MLRLIKSVEWKPFVELLSPRFFEVVPVSTVLSQVRTLGRNYFDAAGFTEARKVRATTLAQVRLGVELVDALSAPAVVRASTVLELYFHQMLRGGTVLLDLRSECFAPRGPQGEEVAWSPQPAYVTFDPEFHRGLRELYFGFYLDDATRFSAGARGLGLEAAEGPLRAQFGVGDQTRVRFSLLAFQQRFQAVFDACKASATQLHPGFIGLGVGLATLYSHLEQTGGDHDVRAAFLRASSEVAEPL